MPILNKINKLLKTLSPKSKRAEKRDILNANADTAVEADDSALNDENLHAYSSETGVSRDDAQQARSTTNTDPAKALGAEVRQRTHPDFYVDKPSTPQTTIDVKPQQPVYPDLYGDTLSTPQTTIDAKPPQRLYPDFYGDNLSTPQTTIDVEPQQRVYPDFAGLTVVEPMKAPQASNADLIRRATEARDAAVQAINAYEQRSARNLDSRQPLNQQVDPQLVESVKAWEQGQHSPDSPPPFNPEVREELLEAIRRDNVSKGPQPPTTPRPLNVERTNAERTLQPQPPTTPRPLNAERTNAEQELQPQPPTTPRPLNAERTNAERTLQPQPPTTQRPLEARQQAGGNVAPQARFVNNQGVKSQSSGKAIADIVTQSKLAEQRNRLKTIDRGAPTQTRQNPPERAVEEQRRAKL